MPTADILIQRWLISFICLFSILVSGQIQAESGKVTAITQSSVDKNTFRLDMADSQLDVIIRDKGLLSKKNMLLEWTGYSAQAVQHYYGRFPVDKVRISMEVTDGNKIRFGQAFGGESPFLRIVVGANVTPEELSHDWIMVHEMVHLAMADLPRYNRWLLEGLATYVESIARAQLGHLSEDFVWRGFLSRMHQGLPQEGDRGLDNTPTWGRTYWGGAMFCMLADVEIRRQSNNRKNLNDALRGILNDGHSMKTGAQAMEIFESGDRATGYPVLVNLYNTMRADPTPLELDGFWQSMGLSLDNNRVVYDDKAPLADIRKRMLKP